MTPPLVRPDVETHRPARRLAGDLAPGTAIPATEARSVMIPLAGADRLRVRAKVTGGAADLDLELCGVDQVPYTAGNPTTVVMASGTEAIIELDATEYCGEPWAKVTITADVDAIVVDFADFSQVGF